MNPIEASPSAYLESSHAQRLVHQGPLGSLLAALAGHPGMGWMVRSRTELKTLACFGDLPHGDRLISTQIAPAVGFTDADCFAKSQAVLLRLADLKAIRSGRPSVEDHRFEPLDPSSDIEMLEWRAWRWVAEEVLCIVWTHQSQVQRLEQRIAQLQHQVQAQQLLLSSMAGGPSGEAGGPSDSLAWSASHFSQQVLREADLSRREHRSFSILLLELDLSQCDADGRRAAIGLVSQQLASGIRTMDTVAQLTDARFGILLSGADLSPAMARAEALRKRLCDLEVIQSGRLAPLLLAIGAAAYPHHADAVGVLLQSAEAALQESWQSSGQVPVAARVALTPP